MPSPAQVAATAAAMAAAQHQYSHPTQSGEKPNRGTKRDHKNTDGMTSMPPLNKRKVVALSTTDRQDRKKTSSSSSSSSSASNNNQDMESMNSSNGGNTTMMTTSVSGMFKSKTPRVSGLNPAASKERRRERNKVLARKTRMKKKEELETLREQVAVLKAENERLKDSMYNGGGSGSGSSNNSISSSSQGQGQVLNGNGDSSHYTEQVHEIVKKMLTMAGMNEEGKRCFCLSNPSAPDCPIVYCSPDFVELTGNSLFFLKPFVFSLSLSLTLFFIGTLHQSLPNHY
jgi:hypothetical protein